jgi:hypothetical protein
MKKSILFFITLIICSFSALTQNWNFKLSGKIEIRNWKLSYKAMKSGTVVNGASIELRNSSGGVFETTSDNKGNFNLSIPANGEFTMTINAQGQHPKKYLVSSKGSTDNNDPNFKPTINISGMIGEKHKQDMNYLGIDRAIVKIENMNLIPRATINDGEYLLIQKFCTANKLGDMAMEKKNYELAKIFYTMAIDMIGTEPYPKDQLKKAEESLRIEKSETRTKTKSKQAKSNSPIKNLSTSKPSTITPVKTSVKTGKSTHKTRMTLGK